MTCERDAAGNIPTYDHGMRDDRPDRHYYLPEHHKRYITRDEKMVVRPQTYYRFTQRPDDAMKPNHWVK